MFKSTKVKKSVSFSDQDGPKLPKYKELADRIATFERRSWPPSLPQDPYKLAEAGFYYTGKVI